MATWQNIIIYYDEDKKKQFKSTKYEISSALVFFTVDTDGPIIKREQMVPLRTGQRWFLELHIHRGGHKCSLHIHY